MLDFDQLRHLIGLNLIEGVGPILAKRLVAYCGSPKEVFRQPVSQLSKIPGIGEIMAKVVSRSHHVLEKADEELQFCNQHRVAIITYLDETYPARLKFCDDSPTLLFLQGNTDLNAGRMVNVVGTREPSAYGKTFTEKLVEELAAFDLTIVSGMAYGIDITTHKACLQHKIPTIGVMAHGMDVIYPGAHSNVANKMVSGNGAILTEFMSGTGPDKENFPKRNRIVAGMCDATIVIETGVKGGSMITARLANDYSRDVFALPGSPFNEKSQGCNFLIKTNRAALFENASDIAQLMGWKTREKEDTCVPANIQTRLMVDLTDDEKLVTGLLAENGKLMVDKISLRLDQPVSKVSVTLLNLEFKGAVRSLPGKMYELA